MAKNAAPDLPIGSIKSRASPFWGFRLTKVHTFFNTVIELSHLRCHNVLYFLNDPYTFALHFRILQNIKHPDHLRRY